MKSKTSLFNKAVFKRNLTGCAGLWVGILLLYLFMLPFQVYFRLSSQAFYMNAEEKAHEQVWKAHAMIQSIWGGGYLIAACIMILAVITAMFVFSYLFTSRNANMMHTFPVNRLSLFGTNYASGLLFLIVPQLLCLGLALLVGASYGALTEDVFQCALAWAWTSVVESIFFFSLAVCVLMFSGNIIAVPVFYGILNFLYEGCTMIVDAMIETVCYGVTSGIWQGVNMLTPLLYLGRHVRLSYEEIAETGWKYTWYGSKTLLIYLAAAVVLVVTAVIAYQRKQIETAGDVITVGWLKPIFRWGAAICSSALSAVFFAQMLYYASAQFWKVLLAAFVTGALVFFAAQMLIERSMRVFTKKRVRECIIYTICIGAVYIGLDADIIGLERKIPKTDEIQSVSVSGRINLISENPQEIAWIQDIHKQIVESKSEFEQAARYVNQAVCPIRLSYQLKDGSYLERYYQVPYEEGNKDSVYAQVLEYADRPDVILRGYFGVHYPDIEITGGSFEQYQDDGSIHDIRIYEENAKKLYEAMIKDVEAGHFAADYEDKENADYESVDTASAVDGSLVFYIRDEQGLWMVHDGYASNKKEGESESVWLDAKYTYLLEALKELGDVK